MIFEKPKRLLWKKANKRKAEQGITYDDGFFSSSPTLQSQPPTIERHQSYHRKSSASPNSISSTSSFHSPITSTRLSELERDLLLYSYFRPEVLKHTESFLSTDSNMITLNDLGNTSRPRSIEDIDSVEKNDPVYVYSSRRVASYGKLCGSAMYSGLSFFDHLRPAPVTIPSSCARPHSSPSFLPSPSGVPTPKISRSNSSFLYQEPSQSMLEKGSGSFTTLFERPASLTPAHRASIRSIIAFYEQLQHETQRKANPPPRSERGRGVRWG